MTEVQDLKAVSFLDITALHEPMRGEFVEAFAAALDTSAFIGGGAVEQFEAAFAEYCQTRHAVGVANGTDALELILRGLGIGPGDEVVVPANTFIATVEAVVAVGARPRFADVHPDTLLLDPASFEVAITPATRAVIPVHLYGQVAPMENIAAIADRHGIAVVEDACQAHGATRRGARAGSLGVAAAFSFYPGKNLGALGDAGAVTTNNAALADAVRSIANHGQAENRYLHPRRGRNSRLDALQAEFLRIKLGHLDAWNAARVRAHGWYAEALAEANATGEVKLVGQDPAGQGVFHLEIVQVADRERVADDLRSAGIGVGFHYPLPCHEQSAYVEFADGADLPVTLATSPKLLSLPMHPLLTREQVEHVSRNLVRAVRGGM